MSPSPQRVYVLQGLTGLSYSAHKRKMRNQQKREQRQVKISFSARDSFLLFPRFIERLSTHAEFYLRHDACQRCGDTSRTDHVSIGFTLRQWNLLLTRRGMVGERSHHDCGLPQVGLA